jgi:hypothetical protein
LDSSGRTPFWEKSATALVASIAVAKIPPKNHAASLKNRTSGSSDFLTSRQFTGADQEF